MKILHIMNWFWERMGYQENHLPLHQAELGNDVRIICSKDYPDYRKFVKDKNNDGQYQNQSLEIKRLDGLSIRFITEQNWYFGLAREIKDFSPDVIQLHHIWDLPTIQFLIARYPGKEKAKVFVDNHIDNGNFNYTKLYKRIYYFGFIKKMIVPLMLKKGFIFIAVNPYSQHCLNSYFAIPQDKIKPLFLGVNNDKIFFSQAERKRIREKYGINDNDIVFMFSGVFEPSKSLDNLIDAFKILNRRYSNVFLLMVGQGILPEDEEFNSLQQKGKVILSEWQQEDNLYHWYSAADIGVMSGKLGGLRDILAAGRPLIVSNDLAVSYLVENNNGLIFKRGDVNSLVFAMEQYIKNTNLIVAQGNRSRELVNSKLSWKKVAAISLDLYVNS